MKLLCILGKRHKLQNDSIWSFLHSLFLFLCSPNIRLRIVFANTFSLYSYLIVRDYHLNLYSTTGIINVLYISIFKFNPNLEDKHLDWIYLNLCDTELTSEHEVGSRFSRPSVSIGYCANIREAAILAWNATRNEKRTELR